MDPANRAEVIAIGKKEVPTLGNDDINAIIDSAQQFKLWTTDGLITRDMWATAHAVVRSTGILDKDISFEDVIEPRFAAEVAKELK
jgi:hypothetical protein